MRTAWPTADDVEARVVAVSDRAATAVRGDKMSLRRAAGFRATRLARLFGSLDDDGRRALGMWAHQQCMEHYDADTRVEQWLLREVAGCHLEWTAAEVRWLIARSDDTHAWWNLRYLLPLAAAESVPPRQLDPIVPDIEEVLEYMQSRHATISASERRPLVARMRSLLDHVRPVHTGLPASLLHAGDAFGPTARRELGDLLVRTGVPELLLHCADVGKVEPTRKWRARAEALSASAPDGVAAVRALLEIFRDQRERPCDGRCGCRGSHPVFTHEDTDTLVRGMVWVVADLDDDWVTPLLADVTTAAATAFTGAPGYPRAPRVANSAVVVLARRPGQLPLTTLARLAVTVKNKALQTRLQVALTELGALRGWSLTEVMELAVNDHGLDPDGRLVEKVGDYEARVEVLADKARLAFARDGKPLKSVPAAVKQAHGDQLRQLRALVKEIGATMAAERQRLETLLSDEREWAYADWVSRYLDHPITGAFGRRLLWETTVDADRWFAGSPRRDPDGWVLVDADGAVARGDRVRLWHPIRARPDEVGAWRDHLMASGLRQPFKQAFREVYLLTPAEEETRTYSNRFAGHVLRYRQANALMRVRGWRAAYLGGWDGGYDSEATKEFGGGRWRASFYHELVGNEDPHDSEARYCSTDQLRFARRDGAVWEHEPVTEVPPLVFSEAMRDVDLFIGITSIAADPQWADRGEDRFHAYWESTAFGELTASAYVRRDALSRLLPRTKIADRVELTERFLRVRGTRRIYKIHLGSGNILMEPNDAYLCIVAAREKAGSLHLPFEEDAMLSMILSKAFLLAADDKITDGTILRQIR